MSTFKELQEKYPNIEAKDKKDMLKQIASLENAEKDVINLKQEVQTTLKLSVEDANNYMNIIGLVLVGDDRLKPLQQHFIEMIKRNNEENSKQSAK